MGRLTLLLIAVLLAVPVVSAQDTNEPLMPDNLPDRVILDGLSMIWQDVNRCSAAALTIQLSYWRSDFDYSTTIRYLNPHSEDMSVRLDEMIAFAESYGLQGIERLGGTVDMLRLLVANGFPVLVENVYYDGPDAFRDWMSHNRVINGYDDNLQLLYSYDSLLGNGPDNLGRTIPYSDMDSRWRPLNRPYLVLYEPEQEELLRTIMGDQWDPIANAEWNLQMVQADLNGDAPDSFDTFNLGQTLVELGRYEEAAAAFDEAQAVGLPWRMLWYQFGPFEAYLGAGRYDDVFQLTRDVIAVAPGVDEMYYYIALAYEATGQTDRAIANLEAALWRNANYHDARDLKAELERG